tara:strand:- start:2235 stop:2564 length:330 start_codon:yes stop_codon:yes gene_type:complete
MKALVFHARQYSFPSRDTGEIITGNDVAYMEIMEPTDTGDEKGLAPMSVSASEEVISSILASSLPAVCDVDFARRPGRRGKPESVMTVFKAGKPWRLEDTLGAAAVAPK